MNIETFRFFLYSGLFMQLLWYSICFIPVVWSFVSRPKTIFRLPPLSYSRRDVNTNSLRTAEHFVNPESFSELLDEVENKKIQELYFSNDMKKIYALRKDDENNHALIFNEDLTYVYSTPSLTQTILDSSRKSNTKSFVLPEPQSIWSTFGQASNILSGAFSSIFYVFLLVSLVRASNRGGNNGMGMGNNLPSVGNSFFGKPGNNDIRKDKENMQKANISLSDWAGSPEIFEECNEVVSYLKNDTNYRAAGAQIPKGILLEGPPGTGKTLIAKAIASECNANFISVASSEFVEVFVGLGAQKVRNLFQRARDNTPCVLFIDEIDSIGKQRGTGVNLGNDEREQTLNQLLAEMDGFNSNEGVLVLAATNRRDVLDSALLRPGRFDRLINVPLPDKESRKAIFKVHCENKDLQSGIEYDFLAELSAGFSGAQIKNLVNEAAILAARAGRTQITQCDLEESLEKLVVGIVKKMDTRSDETRTRVAIHESGHALLAALHSDYFNLKKATIQATYNGAGGYTLFNDKDDISESGLYTKEGLKKRLIVAMGGKAAEALMYGEDFVSLGAVQDLKTANSLAQSMIGNYGMGEELKVFYNENTESGRTPFLGRSLAMGDKYSDKTKEKVDDESLQLVNEAYREAYRLLFIHKAQLLQISNVLVNVETIAGDTVVAMVKESHRMEKYDEMD